ncbi:class I SAM-dependent methyltransferase [Paracraurococcus lichenis]|uniref:Class I SAM-dependent methyltransferase n=1 Tax=Paracraurococcus lichenis TaxID=3064888 RepID=A0ABT9DWE4_9PROT|nr:class I SAM-dependent methyltransferase [Paracraurococcus sp. LOR1-02]MDO9708222.1 class I SAM-dependent methyltransferase [Paracraurococcus sp. LOR1-02]
MEPAEYDLMDAAEDGMWWYRALHAQVLDALDRAAPWHGPLLDAGCGTGGFLARLRRQRPDQPAAGVEYHARAAARAAAKSGVPVAVGTVNALPFADASFGAVVSLDVLCHAAVEPGRALAEMLRVLRPGGVLVVNLPAFDWLRSTHDLRVQNARRYTARSAAALLAEAGLVRVRPHYWNSLLLPLMVLQRKVLARAPEGRSDVAPFPPWIDRSLHAVCRLERLLQHGGLPFPAGGSVLATALRP